MFKLGSHGLSIAKTISWRVLGSLDTFLLGWLITGHAGAAGAIASTEVMTKFVLYYFHERAWLKAAGLASPKLALAH